MTLAYYNYVRLCKAQLGHGSFAADSLKNRVVALVV